MNNYKSIIAATILVGLVICLAGCNDHKQKKQAMVEKWEQNKAMANMPIIEEAIQKGELKKAEQMLQESIGKEPSLYVSHYLMGQIHYMRDNLENAETCFKKSVELEGDFDKGWYWLGETARADDDFNAAIKYYKKAADISPEKIEYTISLAQAYAEKDDYNHAIDLLDKKIRAFSNQTSLVIAKVNVLVSCGRQDEVVDVYKRAILSNSGSIELLEGLGYCYLGQKDWANAEDTFERLLKLSDAYKKDEYLNILSTCCMNTGQYNKALGYLDKLHSDAKDDPDFWLQSGQAALGAQEAKRAIFCANRSLYLKPGWSDGYVLLGCGYYMNGDYQKALDTFSKMSDNLRQSDLVKIMTDKCNEKIDDNVQSEQEIDKVGKSDSNSPMLSLSNAEVQ